MVPSGTPGSFIAAMRQCRSDGQRQHPTGSGNISLPHIPGTPCRGNISTPCVPRGGRSWQYSTKMHPQSAGRGIIPPRCIPGRSPMAKCPRNAFPQRPAMARFRRGALSGYRPWQDIATVRFRAADRGNISPRCVFGRRSVAAFSLHAFPKGPRTGKAPVRGNISPPCIRNELVLARYSRHASEKRRKRAFGDTPREDLARKGPFSLRGPLRSCTARGSCRRSALERKKIGQSQKIAGVSTRTRSKVVTSY